MLYSVFFFSGDGSRIELSRDAAGILGGTSRAKLDSNGQPVMTSSSENGEGIIDGVIEDYELSSITSTDFKYSQFSGRMRILEICRRY